LSYFFIYFYANLVLMNRPRITIDTIPSKFWHYLLVILLVISVFYPININQLSSEEPRRAVTAMETFISGHYIVPQIHEAPYYNKPPFYNWVIAGFFRLTGSFEEWVVRMPGLISYLLTALLVFWLAKKHTSKQTAFITAIAYLTSADLFFYASYCAGQIDFFYSFLVLLQAYSFFFFYQKRQYWLMFIISYLFTAVGILTKGLPSIAFQIITIGTYLIYLKQWKLLFSIKHLSGILISCFLLISYFSLYAKYADNLNGFLINLFKESSERTINEYSFTAALPHILTFPFKIAVALLPWSVFGVFLFQRKIKDGVKNNPLLLFSALFILSNIIIYWLSPHYKDRYTYMFIPPILLIIFYFYQEYKNTMPQKIRWAHYMSSAIMILLAVAYLACLFIKEIRESTPHITFWSISFFIFGTIVFILFYKAKKDRLCFIFLSMIVAKFAYNVLLLPYLDRQSVSTGYQHDVEQITQIVGNAPVYYTGKPNIIKPYIAVMGHTLVKDTLQTPPLLPYQIPYFITKKTGRLLTYVTETRSGNYYLVHLKNIKDYKVDVLYRFDDKWTHQKMILYRKW
jgi:4-amino-4-deoxy-L-arabinose transferase-like glycosyltransferase